MALKLLQGQYYPIYLLQVPPRPRLHSFLLFGQNFLSSIKNVLKHNQVKATLYML